MKTKLQQMLLNGTTTVNMIALNKTLYSSSYMVVNDKEYTKHYYIEGERICTKIGGGFGLVAPLPPLDTAGTNTISFAAQLWTMVKRGFECAGNKVNDISILPGFSAINNSNNLENYRYYYHPDHLGSSSFITNQSGNVIEHLQYMPYGENFISQRSGRYDTPYKFSGKEKDEETQYSYFGARYYDSDLSVWLSVDPFAGKYPSLSPYNYCAGNPIKFIDPNGKWIDDYFDKEGNYLGSDNAKTDYIRIIDRSTYNAIRELGGKNKNFDPGEKMQTIALQANGKLWGSASTNENTDTKILNHYYTEAGYNLSELSSPVKIGGKPNNSVWATRLWGADAEFTFGNNYPVPSGYEIPDGYIGVTVDRGAIGTDLINKWDVINMYKHERGGHGEQYLNKKPFSERDATLFQVQDQSWNHVSPEWKNHMFKAYGDKLNKLEQKKYFWK